MALRILTCTGLLYQELIRSRPPEIAGERLPAVLPDADRPVQHPDAENNKVRAGSTCTSRMNGCGMTTASPDWYRERYAFRGRGVQESGHRLRGQAYPRRWPYWNIGACVAVLALPYRRTIRPPSRERNVYPPGSPPDRVWRVPHRPSRESTHALSGGAMTAELIATIAPGGLLTPILLAMNGRMNAVADRLRTLGERVAKVAAQIKMALRGCGAGQMHDQYAREQIEARGAGSAGGYGPCWFRSLRTSAKPVRATSRSGSRARARSTLCSAGHRGEPLPYSPVTPETATRRPGNPAEVKNNRRRFSWRSSKAITTATIPTTTTAAERIAFSGPKRACSELINLLKYTRQREASTAYRHG